MKKERYQSQINQNFGTAHPSPEMALKPNVLSSEEWSYKEFLR
jgi:hypothetical protein